VRCSAVRKPLIHRPHPRSHAHIVVVVVGPEWPLWRVPLVGSTSDGGAKPREGSPRVLLGIG